MTNRTSIRAAVARLGTPADLTIVAVCLIAGALVGSTYYRQVHISGGKPWFYQIDFGPAVMSTCGHGFVVPDADAIPPLARFLQQDVDGFACADLPEEPPLRQVTGAQPWLMWSHLLRAAALSWSITGISWSGLSPLAGTFFATTVALAFVLLRRVCRPVLALAGAVFVLTSPLFLVELPQFRDFSKVPFMLALVLVMTHLLTPAVTTGRLLILSAVYGALLGFGIGFRNDLLITVPPFIGLLLLARSPSPRQRWRRSAIALLVAAVTFLLLAIPVLRVYANGGGASMSHAALLGMMSPIDPAVGMTNGGLYEVGYGLEDSYAAAIVSGYASRSAGRLVPIEGHSREYDAAATGYFLTVARGMPADVLARAYASIDRVVGLPSSVVETQAPPHVESPLLRRFYSLRSRLALALSSLWLPVLGMALLFVSLKDLRLALVLALLVIYFTAYPSIQFNARHVMQLSLIPIAAALYALEWAISRQWGGSLRNAAIVAVTVLVLMIAPLAIARWYQQVHVTELLRAYVSAPSELVELSERALPDGRVALDLGSAAGGAAVQPHGSSVVTDFLIVELGSPACDAAAVTLTLRYDTSHAFADFTHQQVVSLPASALPVRVLIAAYSYVLPPSELSGAVSYRPRGFELPSAQRKCVSRVTRLRDPARFPVLLNASLPSYWERLPLYQTLPRWETRAPTWNPAVYVAPPELHVARRGEEAVGLVTAAELVDAAGTVTMPGDGHFVADGTGGIGGAGHYSYLARYQERSVTRGQRLIAEGVLVTGGLSVGLLRDGAWSMQLPITDAGAFRAEIAVPEDGNYAVVIANNLRGPSLKNVFEVARLAWTP